MLNLVVSTILSEYPGSDLTPLKLQKLLFYSYGGLVSKGVHVTDPRFEAWKYGPVISHVYQEYKVFGSDPIDRPLVSDTLVGKPLKIIQSILSIYGGLSGSELVRQTHLEAPWITAWKKGPSSLINFDQFVDYFSNKYAKGKIRVPELIGNPALAALDGIRTIRMDSLRELADFLDSANQKL